jgi:hypothetical protein
LDEADRSWATLQGDCSIKRQQQAMPRGGQSRFNDEARHHPSVHVSFFVTEQKVFAGRQGERPLLCLARLDVTHFVDVTQLVLIHPCTTLGQADQGSSHETLLDKLAGSNPELRKQLQQLLGSENFESPDPSSTKH